MRWRPGPIIVLIMLLVLSCLWVGLVPVLTNQPDGGRGELGGTIHILNRVGIRTRSHAFNHNTKEFRANDWGALFAWIERLGNLPIQKEELTTASVQDYGDNHDFRTYLFFGANGVSKHHRDPVPWIP